MQQQLSRHQICSRIKPRLLSSEYQAHRLSDMIKKHIAADLWLCWYADLTDILPPGQIPEDASAFAPVTTDFAERFHLTVSDLLHIGFDNTRGDYSARPINSVLSMLCDASLPVENAPVQMYVLTNKEARYGAAAVLDPDIQAQMRAQFGNKFLLLPSSTSEFLCIPADGSKTQAAEVAHMVRTINHDPNVMRPEDILSDHVYCIEDDTLAVVV